MRRPIGVVVAAIFLGLLALLGVFGSLISMVVSLLVHNVAVPPVPGFRVVMLVSTGLTLCFFLFCLWTAVALFRMRPWARYSILAIGGLEFCFSLLLCGTMLLVRSAGPPVAPLAQPSPISYQAIFVLMAIFYGFLSLIGLWWLVYFNLASVRAAFAGASLSAEPSPPLSVAATIQGKSPVPGWRVVIIVWACLMLLGVLFLPMVLLMHMPVFLFDFILRGGEADALLLILVAVQLYLGVGLLKKWKPAWYVGFLWQLYTVAAFLAFLVPGVWSRFAAYQQELMARWGFPHVAANSAIVAANPEFFVKPGLILGAFFGAAMVLLFTLALLRRREDYLHA